jgi:AcrR family transcriptional regulator
MDKKNQICNATLKLMKEKGFDSLRVNEIAEKAGVSKRTLYRYFPSKKELISHIISEKHNRIKERLMDIFKTEGNEADKYETLLTCVTAEIASENVELFENLKKYPDIYEEIKEKQKESLKELETIIENGISKGEIKSHFQPKIVSYLLIKLANIIFEPEFFLNNKVTFEEVTNNLKNIVLYGLKTK